MAESAQEGSKKGTKTELLQAEQQLGFSKNKVDLKHSSGYRTEDTRRMNNILSL